MHPDDLVGTSARSAELADRDRRRVGGEDDLRPSELSEPREDRGFGFPVLGRRLDHEVHIGQGVEVGRGVDPAERFLGRGRVELPALDRFPDRPLDAAAAGNHQLVRSLHERHAETGACAHLDDARAHEACADHSDAPDVRGFHRPRIGDPARLAAGLDQQRVRVDRVLDRGVAVVATRPRAGTGHRVRMELEVVVRESRGIARVADVADDLTRRDPAVRARGVSREMGVVDLPVLPDHEHDASPERVRAGVRSTRRTPP